MSLFRRLLLFLPIAVLTLFFALCGWESWHLPMGDVAQRDVWLEGNAFALTQLPAHVRTAESDDLAKGDYADIERLLKRKYPAVKARFLAFDDFSGSAMNIMVGLPVMRNRFYATNQICLTNSYTGGWQKIDVEFSRSPLRFWDSSWYITRAKPHGAP